MSHGEHGERLKPIAPEIEAAAVIAVGEIAKGTISKEEEPPDGERILEILEISFKPLLKAKLLSPRSKWLKEINAR